MLIMKACFLIQVVLFQLLPCMFISCCETCIGERGGEELFSRGCRNISCLVWQQGFWTSQQRKKLIIYYNISKTVHYALEFYF